MVLGSWQVFALPLLAISHRCYLIPLMGINVLKMKMKNKMCTRNASLLLFLSGAKQCINKQKGEPNQAKFVIMNVLFSEKGRWTSITFFCYSESAYRLWQQRKFKKDSHIPQIISRRHIIKQFGWNFYYILSNFHCWAVVVFGFYPEEQALFVLV